MSKLTSTNRSNDCPVCGDISGDCRLTERGGWLCRSEANAPKFEIINGWKKVSTSHCGGWGTFVLDGGKTSDSYAKRKAEDAQLANVLAAAEREKNQKRMAVAERDRHYRAILSQLELDPVDRADLVKRGFTDEQIERYGFKSVNRYQKLSGKFPLTLPGISKSGDGLDNWHEGYLCAATNAQGQIQGFQIRNRHYNGSGAKYPWLSHSKSKNPNGFSAHLQDGKLPVGVYWPDELSVFDAVGICEGFAIKPQIAANRLGAVVIACDSANISTRAENFRKELKEIQEKLCRLALSSSTTPGKGLQQLKQANLKNIPEGSWKVVYIPDGNDVSNTLVFKRTKRTFDCFKEFGLNAEVLWWNQLTKADGDIDEISDDVLSRAKLITWPEFAALAPEAEGKPAAQPQRQVKPALTKAQWTEQQRVERDRQSYAKIAKLLGIEAAINTDDDGYKNQARERFYQPLKQLLNYETKGELISGFVSQIQPQTDGRSLIAYDCSQGTGKSNNALIPSALQVAKHGGRVLIFVPTRGLAKEFKGRINERAGEDIAATHLDEKYYSAAIVVSCPESAYKFKGQTFALIQIDEANEVLHRIESAELGNAGPQSLAAFRRLLAAVPQVAIATAAMSGWTLAAVQRIGGFMPTETYLQRRVRPATEMSLFEYGNYHQWLQRLIDALSSGQRVAVPTGSQGKGRAIDRVLRALFPDKSGLVIDGKATMQNQRSRFLTDPDAFLEMEKPDWFIFTPVINSGVSIEGKHFDIQFEYATPHEGAQSISQRGERIRSAIGRDRAIAERHIYFSQQGAPTLEAYPDAFDWQYWSGELDNEARAPMGAAAALAKALGAEKALKPMQQEAEKFAAMRPHLPHFLALKALEIIYKKELLHEDWRHYGWEVSAVAKPDKVQAEKLKELKVFCEKVTIGLIEQQGRTLKKTQTRASESDFDEINNPFQAARAAKFQLEKLLGKDYLVQQDSEFFTAWGADKSAKNPGVRAVVRSQLLQIAISNPECWRQIEQMKALKILAGKPNTDSDLFWSLPELPAAARDIELVSIIARCPGIAEVVGGVIERWTNQDPQVVAAGLYLVAHRKQIAANTKKSGLVRGAKFSEQMAPAALFNKAVEICGYKPMKDKREGSGSRLNIYRLGTAADAVAALQQLKEEGEDGLKLFRAELHVIRAQSRQSINAAAQSQIISRALAWVSEQAEEQVTNAIAAIKQRHADLIDIRFSNLGDAVRMGADSPPDGTNQMAFLRSNTPPPPPKR